MNNPPDDLRHISSAANPLVKLARQLATRRRARYRERLFVLEGVKSIATALEHHIRLQTLIIEEERQGDVDPALLASLVAAAEHVVSMPAALFVSFTDAEHPQPLAALANLPDLAFPPVPTCIVCLDAVRDPGNLGTILRTAAAAGVDGIALLPGCVDPFNPKVVRASAGLVTAIPIRAFASVEDVISSCFSDPDDVLSIAGDSTGMVDYRDVDWKKPLVVVVGNEASGVSDISRQAIGLQVRIPMALGVESLNVSVATAILLFEMRSHRSGRIR